ncbi:hypothetical protein JOC95_001621 [Bacillus tianshenii]|uniref:DUF3800 domain-containing protein n=1 Tax=Sutcliffiella tianshenii TaxID=1463404 RepID=A0ABS2NYL3_9BACI|nr:DUF3800 domain-containing protein [Bacillus tianshenii]MBM7619769.1 hypothetical protein [Bacillus tianshenii]
MSENERLIAEIEEEILNDGESEEEVFDEEKEAEKRKKAEALWEAIQNGETKNISQKVASILNRFDETRNSDIALMIKYWQIFENHSGTSVGHEDLFKLERLTTIARARAKIQNEFKLFLSTSEKVRRARKELSEVEAEYQIATKPELPIIHIYADETGKTDDYLIVGSFWVLENTRHGQIKTQMVDWINEKKTGHRSFPSEFHFKEFKNDGSQMELYKEFINTVIRNGDSISFKAIGVNKRKIRREAQKGLLEELYYQLLRLGVNHEIKTGRIALPKQISYVKDLEGNESRFLIEQMSQKIIDNLKTHYENNLRLNSYLPLDSRVERYLQVADLFTASINRIINFQPNNKNRNAKDALADYILSLTNLQIIKLDAENFQDITEVKTENDMAVLYLFN